MSKYFIKQIEDKLMLASRDIQVGDKDYYYINSTQNNKVEKAPDYWNIKAVEAELDGHVAVTFDNSTFLWIEEVFKIIGEISSEALSYCKEGMEYEKENVEEYYKADDGNWYRGHCIENMLPTIKYNLLIKIKGPCGHFH